MDEAAVELAVKADSDGEYNRPFYEAIEIEIRPGALVVVDWPGERFSVSFQFKTMKQARRRAFNYWPNSWPGPITDIYVNTYENEVIDRAYPLDLEPFRNAMTAYLATSPPADWKTLPKRLPEQGKRPDLSYYRDLLALEEELKKNGSTRPAADIAARLGKNRATIRTHLSKARELLGNQRSRS
jgi:hypothetical protein